MLKTVKAKSILSPYKIQDRWFGSHYNMNLYRGCNHGCIYCDSRSECYHVENFDQVHIKENALTILEKELQSKQKKGVVGCGAMSDPYNSFELKEEATRNALKLINAYKFGISLATKSNIVCRDIDILQAIQKHSPTLIKTTITANDKLSQLIEPHAPLSSDRFQSVKELSHAGIFTGILIMPLLPYINDNWENIAYIIEEAYDAGVRFIFPGFGVTLRDRQRDYYYTKLESLYPGLKNQYVSEFGDRYSCFQKSSYDLGRRFEIECQKRGILTKMPDIIKAYQSPYEVKQFTLF